jgi:4'-phosphopantetheinyl transferase
MPLFVKKDVAPHSVLGIWKINEDEETLYALAGTRFETDDLIRESSARLRIQRLCARLLLKELTGMMDLGYTSSGKPYLLLSGQSISISHSAELVAIIASDAPATGIDIEPIRPRIIPLAGKFLSVDELTNLDENVQTDQLHVYWGAKEALYKLQGEKGLIFSEQILIQPFSLSLPQGKLSGLVQTKEINRSFDLIYEKMSGHMLVYVTNG